MWENLVRAPLGSLSMRKLIAALATLMVACFVYIFISAPNVHAVDGNWQGDSIIYDTHTYTGPNTATTNQLPGVAAGTVFYQSLVSQTQGTPPTRAFIIYFSPGTSPPTAQSATFTDYKIANGTYSDPQNKKTITLQPQAGATTSTTGGSSSCEISGGLGWIICPVTRTLASGMDVVYGLIDGFLEVRPLATSQDQPLYKVWAVMRDIANILFILGFLILVYGQITGGVISNYTIKKILPRIVVAAVMVNLSYWISAIAVDFFNVIGYSIKDVFDNIRDSLVSDSSGNKWHLISAESIASLVLSGGSAAAGLGIAGYLGITSAGLSVAGVGLGSGLIILILPMLLGLLFIILVTFLILAARQAIITIFIVISPIAFAAYLLPNTEKWFDKWRNAFLTLLVVFPAFSVVFGGSQLAAAIILQRATSFNEVILAWGVQVAPLAITPLLLRLGGGTLNRFAGIINNPTKGVFDRGKNWARERNEQNQARGRANLALGRKIARSNGLSGLARLDENGNPLRDRSGNIRTRNRFGAGALAYRRDVDRMTREGLKKENEAMAEGLFAQTKAGSRVYQRGQEASYEKHYADSINKEAWTHRVHGNPRVPGSHGDHYLHDLHHQSQLADGRVKVIEDADAAHVNEELQTFINDSRNNYRQIKLAGDVAEARAQVQLGQLTADGKLAAQRDIDNDRALKLMKVASYVAEQQASSIDTRLTKNAEARWNQLSRTDANLQQLRLQEVQATDSAKRVEEQWNTLIANIKAGGGDAPEVAANNASIANSIQSLAQDIQVEAYRQDSASTQQKLNLATEFKTNETLRNYAGGIMGESGATRIYAKATSEIVSEYVGNIKNARSLLSEYSANELIRLSQEGIDRNGKRYSAENDAMRIAAQQEILLTKGNNWAFQKEKDYVAQQGMIYDEDSTQFDSDGNQIRYFRVKRDSQGNALKDPSGAYQTEAIVDSTGRVDQTEISRRRDIQQMFVDGVKNTKLQIKSISGTDRSDMETGLFVQSGKQAIIRDANDGKVKPDRWADMDYDEMMRTVQLMRENGAGSMREQLGDEKLEEIRENINKALTDPRLNVHLENRQIKVLKAIQNYAGNGTGDLTDAERLALEGTDSKVPRYYDYEKPYDRGDPTGPA